MNRMFGRYLFRRLCLRGSSLALAGVLLLATAGVLATQWLGQARLAWLVVLMSGLFLSTLFFLWRQGPVLWRDITAYRGLRQPQHMQVMHHHVSWRFDSSAKKLSEQCQTVLTDHAYRMRVTRQGERYVISAVKGRLNRLGLLLCHLAVLLVLLGATLDSELGLKYQLHTGKLQAETQEIPLHEMGAKSRIPARSGLAFRGAEAIQIGQIVDEVRVRTTQGFLTRQLPYAVSVQHVELDTGQLLLANNYLSKVLILDPQRDNPQPAILAGNRPFRYKGYVYFQQAVQDAGSELVVDMWPLQHASVVPLRFRTQLGAERPLQTRQGRIVTRFVELTPRNIQPVQEERNADAEFKNIGPSLVYKVSEAFAGEREFINYLLPIKQNGRYYHVTGVRDKTDAPFNYIHIPVDHRASLEPYFRLHAGLYDDNRINQAVKQVLKDAGKSEDSAHTRALRATLLELLDLFRDGGFTAIDKNISTRVRPENYPQSLQLSHKLIRSLLYAIYVEPQASSPGKQREDIDLQFFEDAMPALSRMAEAAMPFYIQLQDMTFKPLVRLSVSRRPGEMLFLGGCVLLLIGLLGVFYFRHGRLWLLFEKKDRQTLVSMAGMGQRRQQTFSREFNTLFADLQKAMQGS